MKFEMQSLYDARIRAALLGHVANKGAKMFFHVLVNPPESRMSIVGFYFQWEAVKWCKH